ncbi:MAG: 2-oxoglutarate dehydrogenase complex dihydrolipoyllysine-residue succinyltransferase [Georgfuchsia sp.]
MLIEVKVPQLSESVAEATLTNWHKKVGDTVARDENLVDVETDKVVLELPATAAGVLVKVLKDDGATVVAGEVIAQIDTEGAVADIVSTAVDTTASTAVDPVASLSSTAAVMPAARKLMEEKGLTTAEIAGSGRGGRILKEDVLGTKPASTAPAAVVSKQALSQPAGISAEAIVGDRPEQRVPMSRLRARVAERLLQSQAQSAILTTFNEVSMAQVIELRNKYKDRFEKEHGVKLGFMSFFVKAAVAALKRYPILNASVDGNDIVYHGYFDVGIAVSSPRGLVVPILRDVDQMSLAQIEMKIAEFGAKAKNGKLTLEDLTGGTFSISNGGVFGSMLSTPIINPPQSAILGVHATKERPVVEDGQIVIRPINFLAMSYNHCIIDGREAVLGLVAMKEALEDPARLLLDI